MTQNELTPKRVLAVGAHPDDIEYIAGGSIATWVAAGAEITFVICTDGSKGGDATTRQAEAKIGAAELGVTNVEFLPYVDGELEATLELKKQLCELIRKYQPDTVVSFDPTVVYSAKYLFVNHTDHRAAGLATVDAVYPLARDRLTFPEQNLEPHKVTNLLLSNPDSPNFFVDVTRSWDKKMAALAAHKSQFDDMDKISDHLKHMSQEAGKLASTQLAEGFVRLTLS